jgi:hypothetical protein
MKAELEARFEEFETGMRDDPAFDPQAYVRRIVGERNMLAATAHLVGVRLARMRRAAKSKGFDVGI